MGVCYPWPEKFWLARLFEASCGVQEIKKYAGPSLFRRIQQQVCAAAFGLELSD
jgi:hypothetical protein